MRAFAVICLVLLPAVAATQQPRNRKLEGELSGNAFFGNTRQLLANVRAEHERADSGSAFRTQLRFNYGQTTDTAEVTVVNKRSWSAGSNYDWRPFADVTPFVRAGIESSLESRIDRRYSVGTGSRFNIVRDERTDVIVSTGVNGEQTKPLTPEDTASTTTLARGNLTLRLRRDVSARVSTTSESSYGPALTDGDDYTVVSHNTLKVKLARFAALTVAYRHNYDNQAVARGARTKYDGELLFGVLTTF